MQIAPTQSIGAAASLLPLAAPPLERALAVEPARQVTANREGADAENKPRGRSQLATGATPGGARGSRRGRLLDLMI